MDADRAALAEENAALKAELAVARAKASEDAALIVQQTLRIAKLERQVYGQKSERSARLIDQLALTFEELEANATEDELAAEQAVAKTTTVVGFTRKRAERNTFPDHLPRERVVIDPPTACECCGGRRLRKLGEDVTRTLESVPRQWKVIETVREKFSCRDCEKISQAPAPFHAVARGWAGPSLLAMIMFEKFGQHQPLNRQAERYALEGVPIALSTMADAVGSVCTALDPLLRLVEAHVMAAERLHADDTTVPVLASGKTDEIKLPASGTVNCSCPDFRTDRCLVYITAWTAPVIVYDMDAEKETFAKSIFNSDVVYPGFDQLVSEEVEVPGHDGTMIPLSIVHKKSIPMDGSNSCILEGYGAYGISQTPRFTIRWSLAKRGVVFAFAHPRGGSEKGEEWYKAGYKTTKPNTWKDFISCAEYLVKKGYTSPEHLAGTGTSAGGILISRAITERPDLFRAAICNVGCANAMRMEFTMSTSDGGTSCVMVPEAASTPVM